MLSKVSIRSKKKIFILLCFSFSCAYASLEPKPIGISAESEGASAIADFGTSFKIFVNPAALASVQNHQIELFYKDYFSLAEIGLSAFSFSTRLKGHPFAFGISSFGNDLYREYESRIGTSLPFFQNKLFVGASFNYYSLSIKNYGSTSVLGYDVGALYQLSTKMRAAFKASNIYEGKIGKSGDNIPQVFAFAFNYDPIKNITIGLGLQKESDRQFDYHFSAQWKINQYFKSFFGYKEIVQSFNLGLKIYYRQFHFGYLFEYHPQLGGSHLSGAGYEF
jgi:hypothetical protein